MKYLRFSTIIVADKSSETMKIVLYLSFLYKTFNNIIMITCKIISISDKIFIKSILLFIFLFFYYSFHAFGFNIINTFIFIPDNFMDIYLGHSIVHIIGWSYLML